MKNKNRKIRIAVFGHYGNGNLGDEAIATSTIQHIRKHFPNAEVVGMSIRPADTAERYAIEAHPIRYTADGPAPVIVKDQDQAPVVTTSATTSPTKPSIKDLLKRVPLLGHMIRLLGSSLALARSLANELTFLRQSLGLSKGLDLIIVAGSNQFLDNFGGAWGFPYTLLKWTILAKLTGTKIVFVSVGAGPLEGTLSRLLVRLALRMADYISYRDAASKAMVETTWFGFSGSVYPDLASSLLFEENGNGKKMAEQETPTIAINPMPVYDPRYWYEKDENRYLDYVNKIAAFSSCLMERGYPVFFFSTQPKDEDVARDIVGALDDELTDGKQPDDFIRCNRQVDELMAMLGSADIVVATRFHGIVLPLAACTPVLGVCYYRKSSDLLKDMGQNAYFVDLENFSADELIKKFDVLVSNLESEKVVITSKNIEYRKALDEQYEKIFQLLP